MDANLKKVIAEDAKKLVAEAPTSKISNIKHLRCLYNLGLKDAKTLIEWAIEFTQEESLPVSDLQGNLLKLINSQASDIGWTPEEVIDHLEEFEIPHETDYGEVIYPALMDLVDEGKITYNEDNQVWHSKVAVNDESFNTLKSKILETLSDNPGTAYDSPTIQEWATGWDYTEELAIEAIESLLGEGKLQSGENEDGVLTVWVGELKADDSDYNNVSDFESEEPESYAEMLEEIEILHNKGNDIQEIGNIVGEHYKLHNDEALADVISAAIHESDKKDLLSMSDEETAPIIEQINAWLDEDYTSDVIADKVADNFNVEINPGFSFWLENIIAEHKSENEPPKDWDELSDKEKLNFAKEVAAENVQGWDELSSFALEHNIIPDEDTFPSVADLKAMAKEGATKEKPIKSYEDFALNYLKENQGETYVASEVYDAFNNAGYKVSETGTPSGIGVMGDTLIEMALKGKIGSKEKANSPILFYWVPELIKPKKELNQLPPGDLEGIEKGVFSLAGQGKSTGDIIDSITEFYNLVGSASLKNYVEDTYQKYQAAKKNIESFLSENPGLHYKSAILTDASGEDVAAAKAAVYALNKEGKLDVIPGSPADTETAYGWKKIPKEEKAEEPSHSIEAGIQEESMANFIKQGMSANAVAELFSGGTYPQKKLLATANKLYNLYHPTQTVMTKPVGSLPSWAFNKMNSIAENMLMSGKTQEDTAWYIAYNYNLVKSDVAALVKELAKKPVVHQKQLLETTIKLLQVGEPLAGCKVADAGLGDVAPATVAYCQGVIKPVQTPVGEKPPIAETLEKGREVDHKTWTQTINLITESGDNNRSKLKYVSSGGPEYDVRTEAVARVLEEFGFECNKEASWKMNCEYTMSPDLNLSIDDQDNIRKAAIFLSSIDKVGKLPLTCIPKAINYAKEHARGINKTSKPWTNYVFPETVDDWMKTVCEKV
jgi:hypothetical protein